MTSELSFLIDLLLNQRLSRQVKGLVAERIKEIEAGPKRVVMPATAVLQAPSTMANLAHETVAPPPPPLIPKRIVGGEVDTGNGTRGPRKF